MNGNECPTIWAWSFSSDDASRYTCKKFRSQWVINIFSRGCNVARNIILDVRKVIENNTSIISKYCTRNKDNKATHFLDFFFFFNKKKSNKFGQSSYATMRNNRGKRVPSRCSWDSRLYLHKSINCTRRDDWIWSPVGKVGPAFLLSRLRTWSAVLCTHYEGHTGDW
jgi:hypothetical protein